MQPQNAISSSVRCQPASSRHHAAKQTSDSADRLICTASLTRSSFRQRIHHERHEPVEKEISVPTEPNHHCPSLLEVVCPEFRLFRCFRCSYSCLDSLAASVTRRPLGLSSKFRCHPSTVSEMPCGELHKRPRWHQSALTPPESATPSQPSPPDEFPCDNRQSGRSSDDTARRIRYSLSP